uniref:Uncharacterized protein n=1 Tax=Timema monikensis TaxID=170555 RepID=A0A7R9HMM0_9NEOP|nr:unnamed protein product [Timema monikensis]
MSYGCHCETRSADEDNKINCDSKQVAQIDEPHEETDNSNMATLKCEQDDSEGCLNSISPSEHTYSTVSKQIIEGHKKHSRKTPLIPRQMGISPLILSEPIQSRLEKLMLEGDLLEVTLDETYHIWTILQNTKFGERLSDFEEEVTDPYTNQQRKRKIREKYQTRNKALKTRTIIKRFEEYQIQKFLEIDNVKSHEQYQISEKEVALRISHSSLNSSDRMKPRLGYWAVMIDFLQEPSLSNGSSTNEKTNIDGNVNNMNENSTSNHLSYDPGIVEIKEENNSIKGYSDDDFYVHHNFDDGTLAGGNTSTWVGVGSTDIDICIKANGGVDVDASGGRETRDWPSGGGEPPDHILFPPSDSHALHMAPITRKLLLLLPKLADLDIPHQEGPSVAPCSLITGCKLYELYAILSRMATQHSYFQGNV